MDHLLKADIVLLCDGDEVARKYDVNLYPISDHRLVIDPIDMHVTENMKFDEVAIDTMWGLIKCPSMSIVGGTKDMKPGKGKYCHMTWGSVLTLEGLTIHVHLDAEPVNPESRWN